MKFDKDKSKIREDVLSLARIQISDIEYTLSRAKKEHDPRIKKVLYEALIANTAAVFQLFMRACDHISQGAEDRDDNDPLNLSKSAEDLRKSKQESTKNTAVGEVYRFRINKFH